MSFGKRFAPPAPNTFVCSESGNLARKLDEDAGNSGGLPWAGADYAACNFAMGHLRDYLLSALTSNGQVHVETLFAAIGCIAGFANQKHAFLKLKESGYLIGPPAIQIISARNGIELYTGQALNSSLIADKQNQVQGLEFWPIVAGGAVANGLSPDEMVSTGSMINHIDQQVDADPVCFRVGLFEQPKMQPQDLLKLVWPLAEVCFSGRIPGAQDQFGRAKVLFQPAICGYVVQQYLGMFGDRLPVGPAVTITMEAALYATRLPETVLK